MKFEGPSKKVGISINGQGYMFISDIQILYEFSLEAVTASLIQAKCVA